MGLAFIMYGREEAAEVLIESMTRDQDPIIRSGHEICILSNCLLQGPCTWQFRIWQAESAPVMPW